MPEDDVGRQHEGDDAPRIPDAANSLAGVDVPSPPEDVLINAFLQYPFLVDSRSRRWTSDNPVVFVMRGVSGSGKSTVVDAIQGQKSPNSYQDFSRIAKEII